jgi:hypothetical protein
VLAQRVKEIDDTFGVGTNVRLVMLAVLFEREAIGSAPKSAPHGDVRISSAKKHRRQS